jgi:hypothetical protein
VPSAASWVTVPEACKRCAAPATASPPRPDPGQAQVRAQVTHLRRCPSVLPAMGLRIARRSYAANLASPLAALNYAASTFQRTPAALAQPGGVALGAQAGPAAVRQLADDAGLSRFRQVTQTPVNVVLHPPQSRSQTRAAEDRPHVTVRRLR